MTEEILADQVSADTELPSPAPKPETPVEQKADETTENTTEKAAKTFTQEELDEIIRKRLNKEQRKFERNMEARIAEATRPRPVEVKPENFTDPQHYVDALAQQRAEQLVAQKEADRYRQEYVEAYKDREEEARDKYVDFEEVAYNPNLRITPYMAETIQASDIGPELAYHLGSNPKEAERIAKLAPIFQAKELGKLEAKLAADPPAKKSSNAPAPISPVNTRTSSASTFNTTDPRSISSMTTEEWIAAERQRQVKAFEAKQKQYR
jgi:hypothetical protein